MTQEDFRDTGTWPDAKLLEYIDQRSDMEAQRHVEMAAIELIRRSAFSGGGGGGVPSGSAGGALSGSYPNPGLAANAVTNAKLAMAPALTLKGNATGAAAVPQDLTVAQVKTMLGITSQVGITSSTGAPLSGNGVVGDFYLDETSGEWHKKTGAATWTSIGLATAFRGVFATSATVNAATTPRLNQTAFVTDTAGMVGGSAGVAGFAYYTGSAWNVYSLVNSGGSGSTNLSVGSQTATTLNILSDTGTDATIPAATTSLAGLLTATDKTKLDGLANYVHPNHSGDLVSVADGATTIQPDVVTNTKLANMPANTIKGNNTGASGDPVDMTVAQTKTLLAYTAADVANVPAGNIAATNVQTAINELDSEKATDSLVVHLAGAETITGVKTFTAQPVGITGASIVNAPAGNIAATTTQAALNELDTEKQVNLQFQEEGANLGTAGTATTLNFVGAGATAARAGNVVTVTIPGGGSTVYDAGGGAIVKGTPGITFTRTTASVWNFNIPAGGEMDSFNIYSTSGQNPGSIVTIGFNYASNTVTNQSITTARRPRWNAAQAQSGATAEMVVGGTNAAAFRPSINTVSGGNISFDALMGTALSTGETSIGGNF